jgi:hypothetical protein
MTRKVICAVIWFCLGYAGIFGAYLYSNTTPPELGSILLLGKDGTTK